MRQYQWEVSEAANLDKWIVTFATGSAPLTFKIYTGAGVTVMNEKTFLTLVKACRLGPADTHFVGSGGELRCIGWVRANTVYRGE